MPLAVWPAMSRVCFAAGFGGSGLTIKCHEELEDAGVDVFTLGDHAYRKDDVFTIFDRTDRVLRAANYAPDAPGAEYFL